MLFVEHIVLVNGKPKVNQPRERQLAWLEAFFKDKVFGFEVTMANLARVHVIQGKQKLVYDVSYVLLIEFLTFIHLTLQFTSLIERHYKVEYLLNGTEVDFNGIHDKWVVDSAQNVELSLRVVFIAWLQCDRLHGELDLVIVFLLN